MGLLLRRIWFALSAVVAIVLTILSILAVLQHDAILSNLIRQRLSVVVGSTAEPFNSVVELGLPVSMMRNATQLLLRAKETDPLIKAVYLINPSGIVVDSTLSGDVEPMAREITRAMGDSDTGRWTVETSTDLISGSSILDEAGTPVGGILATYPKFELETQSRAITQRMALVSLALLVLFSTVAYVALRFWMRGPISELRRIEQEFDSPDEHHTLQVSSAQPAIFPALSEVLQQATVAYRSALADLARFRPSVSDTSIGQPAGVARTNFVGIAETDLARNIARRLMPLVAAMVLGSALVLAYAAYASIRDSFSPEIAKRTQLIGTVANANIQRAIEAGIPLDQLVGGEDYFRDLTQNLPELSYLGVLSGKPVLEVGEKRSAAQGVSEFPLFSEGERIGTVVTETDPLYFARQFNDMLLDLSVVLLVIVLFAFELVVVMMATSVTLPIDGLQHVAGLQAAGDFSKRLMLSGRNVVGRLANKVSERAVGLNRMLAEAWRSVASGAGPTERLEAISQQYGLKGSGPDVIRLCSLSDVRLPLFLFAMADEFPLSFFSLYARDAENPITWISPGIVIGLPLAGYLLATLFGAPLARPLQRRFGYRNLFLAGAAMTIVANLGLFAATNIIHLIICLVVNGFGFVVASLSCQDYVLDMLPPAVRSRSVGLIRTAMFSGIFAGTALGGIVADRMGQQSVFLVSAMVVLASAALVWRYVPQFRAGSSVSEESQHAVLSFNLLAPMRSVSFASVAFGIIVPLEIIDHVFVSYLLSLQMDALGSTAADIGRALMCFFLMLIIGGTVLDKVPARFAAPPIVAFFSSVVSGVVLIAAAVFPTSASMFLAAAGTGFALGLAGGPQSVLVMDIAEGRLSHLGPSVVLGTVRLLERGGAVVGLLLTGLLTGYIGYSGAIGAIGCLAIVGAVMFALLQIAGRTPMRERVVKSAIGVLCAFLLAGGFSTPAEAARKTVAMVVWIGCEDVCRGVKDFISENGIDADVIVFDAAEDEGKLPGIVEELRTARPDLVITWGTKVTLGVVGSLEDSNDPRFLHDIPVVFTVVSNPVGTKIIESYERTGRPNVTGTRNRVPESVNIKSIRRYMKDFSHLGILYDTSETNSVTKVDEIKALSGELNFSLTALPIASKADGTPDPSSVAVKMRELKQAGVQFVYLGSSTFLEKQQDLFTRAALDAGLPVLSPYEHLVTESNALMSVASRDYDVGKLAATQASKILLDGIQPGELPVLPMEEFAYLVNMRVAKRLNLFPPVEFLQFVEKVE